MSNIIDYIKWRGDISFSESPFNEIDGLIFANLSYINFSGLFEENKKITISEVARKFFLLDDLNERLSVAFMRENLATLLSLLSQSRRFMNVKFLDYVEKMDERGSFQFSCMTLLLKKNRICIAYRGTDDTLAGWKEDFNMSFKEVPSQKEALSYLNKKLRRYRFARFITAGHSKGGNLAIFASLNTKNILKKRIEAVYNFDGPGFRDSVFDTKEYFMIKNKIHTFVPQSSIVGMLLFHDENYTIVKSIQKGIMQHDGFSWCLTGKNFECIEEDTKDIVFNEKTLKNFIKNLSFSQRELFTQALFEILSSNENKTLTDVKNINPKSLACMFKTYENLSADARKALTEVVKVLFSEGFRSMMDGFEKEK